MGGLYGNGFFPLLGVLQISLEQRESSFGGTNLSTSVQRCGRRVDYTRTWNTSMPLQPKDFLCVWRPCSRFYVIPLPETNSSNLTMDGWKTIFLLERGENVSFRELMYPLQIEYYSLFWRYSILVGYFWDKSWTQFFEFEVYMVMSIEGHSSKILRAGWWSLNSWIVDTKGAELNWGSLIRSGKMKCWGNDGLGLGIWACCITTITKLRTCATESCGIYYGPLAGMLVFSYTASVGSHASTCHIRYLQQKRCALMRLFLEVRILAETGCIYTASKRVEPS